MIKASWKVLGGNDQQEEFTVDALVPTPGNSDPSKGPVVPESCRPNGGVGGLACSTSSAPQWVCRRLNTSITCRSNPRPWPSERSVSVLQRQQPGGNQPAAPTAMESGNQGHAFADRSRDRRAGDPGPQRFISQTLLRTVTKSVWANYELISTQWPTLTPQPTCQISPAMSLWAVRRLRSPPALRWKPTSGHRATSVLQLHCPTVTPPPMSPSRRAQFRGLRLLYSERAQSTGAIKVSHEHRSGQLRRSVFGLTGIH